MSFTFAFALNLVTLTVRTSPLASVVSNWRTYALFVSTHTTARTNGASTPFFGLRISARASLPSMGAVPASFTSNRLRGSLKNCDSTSTLPAIALACDPVATRNTCPGVLLGK